MCSKLHNILRTKLLLKAANVSLIQRLSYAAEGELLELFQPKEPIYSKELVFQKEKKHKEFGKVVKEKRKDVIISCKRPEYNYYRNQKYDNFKPIPLASKGWFHKKSFGDYFTIRIYNEDYDIDNHFWEESINNFSDLKLDEPIIQALEKVGYIRPTKIQVSSIPEILSGKNTLIAAETGCGKTLAYLIPVVQKILKWKEQSTSERSANTPLAVVITPSRDLASQIGSVARKLSHYLPFKCDVLLGGRTKHKMLFPKFKNIDLLVASLGVLSKLTTTGIYNMDEVKHLILDESDTLLDDSFNEHVVRYLKKFKIRYTAGDKNSPFGCQLILASATFPHNADNLLANIVELGSIIKVTSKQLHKFLPHVPQTFYRLTSSEKPVKLLHLAKKAILDKEPTIIFSNRSSVCDWISLMLNENGVPVINLNGEMPVLIRRGKYNQFHRNEFFILSSTDIVSRGMDTNHVKHVINYDFPLYMADYVHRCGRTGRCGNARDCRVTNLVVGIREVELVNKIELAVRTVEVLPSVNANITKIIQSKIMKECKIN